MRHMCSTFYDGGEKAEKAWIDPLLKDDLATIPAVLRVSWTSMLRPSLRRNVLVTVTVATKTPHQKHASRKMRRRPAFLCKLAAIGHLPYWKHPTACLFLLFRVACFGGHML